MIVENRYPRRRSPGVALALASVTLLVGCGDTTPSDQPVPIEQTIHDSPKVPTDDRFQEYILSSERNALISATATEAGTALLDRYNSPSDGAEPEWYIEETVTTGEQNTVQLVHDPRFSGPNIDARVVFGLDNKGDLDPSRVLWLYVKPANSPAVTLTAPDYGPTGTAPVSESGDRGWTVTVSGGGFSETSGDGQTIGPNSRTSVTHSGANLDFDNTAPQATDELARLLIEVYLLPQS